MSKKKQAKWQHINFVHIKFELIWSIIKVEITLYQFIVMTVI